MRDWRSLAEHRLSGLALEPEERTEVIAELAAHLEDLCEELRRAGLEEDEAVRQALSRVGDWRDLQRKILAAKRSVHHMVKRIRQLWIPGFLTLALSMLLLTLFYKLGFQPRLVRNGPSEILLYWPWLLSLPAFGALAAYLSSRAGASRGTMFLASVFPAVALIVAFLLMSPIGMAIQQLAGSDLAFRVVAAALLKDAIGWILMPGLALAIGGLLAQILLSRRVASRIVAGS